MTRRRIAPCTIVFSISLRYDTERMNTKNNYEAPRGEKKLRGLGDFMETKIRLLDLMRHVMRLKHMSLRTEEASVSWVRRCILFHDTRHPGAMGAEEIRAFLSHRAVQGRVAASTQNGALNALVFLSRHVLRLPFPELAGIERAKRPRRIPTVFTIEEAQAVLLELSGAPRLMAGLLYGAGLRLMACVRLRVKDVDFAY